MLALIPILADMFLKSPRTTKIILAISKVHYLHTLLVHVHVKGAARVGIFGDHCEVVSIGRSFNMLATQDAIAALKGGMSRHFSRYGRVRGVAFVHLI